MDVGGISRTSTWTPYTTAWVNANALKNYVKNNLGATRLSQGWAKVGHYNSAGLWYYGYINNSANIPNTGDVIVFYDWMGDGDIDHASYCVGTGTSADSTGYGDLIDAHSSARYRSIWHLDHWNKDRYTTEIYAFRL